MSSAPAGLEVLPDAQFSSYRLSVGQIRGLHARILAKVADSGELTGEWKIVLGSAARVPGVFHGTQLYSDPSGEPDRHRLVRRRHHGRPASPRSHESGE